jgi:hypothetical protein
MVNRLVLLVWVACAAACNTFEDPDIVIDLRVLAMRADPADQVIDVDVTQPVMPEALLAQLTPTQVCALVADPGLDRSLAWSMTACKRGDDDHGGRCDPDAPQIEIASGVLDDPDSPGTPPALCGTIVPTPALLVLLSKVVEDDALHGLGGIDYAVVLQIGGVDADRALDQYATKTVRVAPRIPEARTANRNPRLDEIRIGSATVPTVALTPHACEAGDVYHMPPGARVTITPVESPDARETYTVPTLDGSSRTFTETLTYQWLATAGGFSSSTTGGPRDFAGNPALLSTEFHAPLPSPDVGTTFVRLWTVQRDERLGLAWYEVCIVVEATSGS